MGRVQFLDWPKEQGEKFGGFGNEVDFSQDDIPF